MISEGSCDTEIMMLKIHLLQKKKNTILKYVQIENSDYKF